MASRMRARRAVEGIHSMDTLPFRRLLTARLAVIAKIAASSLAFGSDAGAGGNGRVLTRTGFPTMLAA
jgi:hypothetical protein